MVVVGHQAGVRDTLPHPLFSFSIHHHQTLAAAAAARFAWTSFTAERMASSANIEQWR